MEKPPCNQVQDGLKEGDPVANTEKETINGFVPYLVSTPAGENYIFGKPGQYEQDEVITCSDGWTQKVIKEVTLDEWNRREK